MNVVILFSIILWIAAQCLATEYQNDAGCGIMNPNGEYVKSQSVDDNTPQTASIVGGVYARKGEIPFQVSLTVYSWYWPWWTQSCGGTVIGKRCVLTAAHCFFMCPTYKMKSVVAIFGATDLDGDYRQSLTSYDFVTHEDYKPCKTDTKDLGNDIAVIRFSEDIAMGMTGDGEKSVGAVCLPFGNVSDSFSSGKVSGWGKTSGSDSHTSSKLKVAEQHKLDECGWSVSEKQICAANRVQHQNVCSGDSGGPLFTVDNGKATQVGIASYTSPGCPLGGTGIFTRVKSYEHWIRQHCNMS